MGFRARVRVRARARVKHLGPGAREHRKIIVTSIMAMVRVRATFGIRFQDRVTTEYRMASSHNHL